MVGLKYTFSTLINVNQFHEMSMSDSLDNEPYFNSTLLFIVQPIISQVLFKKLQMCSKAVNIDKIAHSMLQEWMADVT
jgi:hypothetical protein